ncbi:Cysteine-rich with EGF-like domain protein 2 [Eumeta japonica]|uniref:Cysteine-rich with EGF-like domain protein 2 n=1 Tax=Eumeta variegata TaxID=151549 RepID=A0A4C1T2A6_EUMVA|nr:Cysteine-rich with EGF-like domain protein 2 [Eumeta japonica]
MKKGALRVCHCSFLIRFHAEKAEKVMQKGLERTARGKYEGGDAAWEEEKLKVSYKRSEMRLIDIQEGICKEETKHGVYCHNVAEKAEEYIEKWWAQNPDNSADLFEFICIEQLELCCPKHHYGKQCSPCLGDLENICNGNGKCRGDGTRKGNDGPDMCRKCAKGYSKKGELCIADREDEDVTDKLSTTRLVRRFVYSYMITFVCSCDPPALRGGHDREESGSITLIGKHLAGQRMCAS